MKYWICLACLMLTSCNLVDKTNRGHTEIYLDCVTTINVTLPKDAADEFIRTLEIDDNAALTMTETSDRNVNIQVEQCSQVGNSTDDDVVNPSADITAADV